MSTMTRRTREKRITTEDILNQEIRGDENFKEGPEGEAIMVAVKLSGSPYPDYDNKATRQGRHLRMQVTGQDDRANHHLKISEDVAAKILREDLNRAQGCKFTFYKKGDTYHRLDVIDLNPESGEDPYGTTGDGSVTGIMVAQVNADGSVSKRVTPHGVSPEVEEEILKGLDAASKIETDDLICDGKYHIVQVKNNVVKINPRPKR